MSNLLRLEPLLIERLKERVADFKTVGSASLLAGAQDIAPYCPAVFVMPGAGAFSDRENQGSLQRERQEWLVTVCLAHIRDPADVETTGFVAGEFLAAYSTHSWLPSRTPWSAGSRIPVSAR